MKYFVVEPFTLETLQGTATLPQGTILELSQDQADRLKGKVEIVTDYGDGKDLPHYCPSYDGWCSEKLPGNNYPGGCIRTKCEHHHEKGELKNEP